MYEEEESQDFRGRLKDSKQSETIWNKEQIVWNPTRELFIWALLMNRFDLDDKFWRILDCEQIGGALTASLLLRQISMKYKSYYDKKFTIKKKLKEKADEYEKKATCILNNCYDEDSKLAPELLNRNLALWGKKSLILLTLSGRHMQFVETNCFQFQLSKIWYGAKSEYNDMEKFSMKNSVVTMLNVFQIPIVKFCLYTLSYVVFLALFAFFITTDLKALPAEISRYEILVWIWSLTMWFDEVRQLLVTDVQVWWKFEEYSENIGTNTTNAPSSSS